MLTLDFHSAVHLNILKFSLPTQSFVYFFILKSTKFFEIITKKPWSGFKQCIKTFTKTTHKYILKIQWLTQKIARHLLLARTPTKMIINTHTAFFYWLRFQINIYASATRTSGVIKEGDRRHYPKNQDKSGQ